MTYIDLPVEDLKTVLLDYPWTILIANGIIWIHVGINHCNTFSIYLFFPELYIHVRLYYDRWWDNFTYTVDQTKVLQMSHESHQNRRMRFKKNTFDPTIPLCLA